MNKYSSRGVILKSYNIMNKWCSKRLERKGKEKGKKENSKYLHYKMVRA